MKSFLFNTLMSCWTESSRTGLGVMSDDADGRGRVQSGEPRHSFLPDRPMYIFLSSLHRKADYEVSFLNDHCRPFAFPTSIFLAVAHLFPFVFCSMSLLWIFLPSFSLSFPPTASRLLSMPLLMHPNHLSPYCQDAPFATRGQPHLCMKDDIVSASDLSVHTQTG